MKAKIGNWDVEGTPEEFKELLGGNSGNEGGDALLGAAIGAYVGASARRGTSFGRAGVRRSKRRQHCRFCGALIRKIERGVYKHKYVSDAAMCGKDPQPRQRGWANLNALKKKVLE